jgi:hypothetical protein
MTDRVIFPSVRLIKKSLTERFLIALREIYKQHPVYAYDDDENIAGMYIYPSYADVDQIGKKPKMLVKMSGYTFSLTDTLYHNMSGEALNSANVISGFQYKKMMSSVASVVIEANAEEESSDIADELTMLVTFVCRGMFGQVSLAITGAQVSTTELVDPAQSLYQTVVNVTFDFPWLGSTTDDLAPVDTTAVDFDLPSGLGVRTPGIEVYRKKLNGVQSP